MHTSRVCTLKVRTAYLGMTLVFLGQLEHFKNIRRGATAKRSCEEQKQHHRLTKCELGYTLIPTMHA